MSDSQWYVGQKVKICYTDYFTTTETGVVHTLRENGTFLVEREGGLLGVMEDGSVPGWAKGPHVFDLESNLAPKEGQSNLQQLKNTGNPIINDVLTLDEIAEVETKEAMS